MHVLYASQGHDLLLSSLATVRRTYLLIAAAQERAETPFPDDASADVKLRELWSLLRPDRSEWKEIKGKEWQEVGFQCVAFLFLQDPKLLEGAQIDELLYAGTSRRRPTFGRSACSGPSSRFTWPVLLLRKGD